MKIFCSAPRFALRLTLLFTCQNSKRLLPFANGTDPIARVKSRISLPPVTVAEPVISVSLSGSQRPSISN